MCVCVCVCVCVHVSSAGLLSPVHRNYVGDTFTYSGLYAYHCSDRQWTCLRWVLTHILTPPHTPSLPHSPSHPHTPSLPHSLTPSYPPIIPLSLPHRPDYSGGFYPHDLTPRMAHTMLFHPVRGRGQEWGGGMGGML